jgi:hypothetical protein
LKLLFSSLKVLFPSRTMSSHHPTPNLWAWADGRAATRDPEDLVGQGRVAKFGTSSSSQWSRADITLTGRGAFGEFVTRKQR